MTDCDFGRKVAKLLDVTMTDVQVVNDGTVLRVCASNAWLSHLPTSRVQALAHSIQQQATAMNVKVGRLFLYSCSAYALTIRSRYYKPRYIYLGDRMTRADLKGKWCDPVRREDGKCIVSNRMATQMVKFYDGELSIVARRRLRLLEKWEARDA